MSNPKRKPIIGILGGIGAGKSTVAAEFVKLGCKSISADIIARQLLEDSCIKKQILNEFGQNVFADGKINRQKLGQIAFSDEKKLKILNNILHPIVLEKTEKLIDEYSKLVEVKAIVLDMPLLAEVGWDKKCDKIVFVDCNEEKRTERVKKSGNFDEKQLKIRENFQISLDIKKKISNNAVDNNSGESALARQVVKILAEVINS